MTIRLRLPIPPSGNRYWRHAVVAGSARVYVSSEAEAYKQEIAWIARAAGVRQPIPGRVCVEIRLFPARPKDWARRARKNPDGWDDTVQCIDLDNARKVLYDALSGIAFDDDKWVRKDAGERCEPDEFGPRVEVTIAPIRKEPIAPQLFAGG